MLQITRSIEGRVLLWNPIRLLAPLMLCNEAIEYDLSYQRD